MVQMVVKGHFETGDLALDVGISDLMVTMQNGEAMLYATSGFNGGLSSFHLASDGSVSLVDSALYNSAWADAVLSDLSLMVIDGAMSVVVAGSGEDQLYRYDLNADGTLSDAQQMNGVSTTLSQLLEVSQVDPQTLYMADANSNMISAYSIDPDGSLAPVMQVADTESSYASQVMAISSAQVMQSEYVISASQSERGVSVYRIDNDRLVNTGNLGVNEGIGIMTPTDMQVVEMGGRSFILLASAPNDGNGQSGAITVMELAQDGSLVNTDHLIDTAHTHFGNVQSLEVVEADGRQYVIAGGGDDGVTLFVLMPNGRLQFLGSVSDDGGLQNVSSMAAQFDGDALNLFVASEAQAGITEITVDLSNQGEMIEASHGGGTTQGTVGDDIIIGGVGNDSLLGGAGNDLLEDGLGEDTLHGGDGADTFILRSDYTHDVIHDFQAGLDRLDLSDWPMLYDTSQIGYTATAQGAILDWRGETLEVFSRDGQTLSFTQIHAAIVNTANRVPDFSNFGGNDGDDEIGGTAINDAFLAGDGNDTVTGLGGDDYLDAGAGHDVVYGDDGRDTIDAGEGNDLTYGGNGEDVIYGNAGNDTIWAGNQADTIFGGDGSDSIRGQQGQDLIYGGRDRDWILGDNSNDTLYGEHGNDVVRGGNGDDLLYGGDGHDRLFGANHEDIIFGGTGNDLIRAGFQADYVDGGAGNDFIVGGGGFDTLIGGEGDDTMQGNFNADRFLFDDGHGHDVILDFEATSNAEKLVFTDLSTMNSFEQVMAASEQRGDDVFIATGDGSSILLENVALTDLHVHDFIF